MRLIRLTGFKAWTVKKRRSDGTMWESRPYYQHRATGLMIDTQKHPMGTPGFYAEAQRIETAHEAIQQKAPKAGTLGGLIRHYFETEHFASKAAATQRDYRRCADYLAPIHDTPVHVLDTPLIAGIHDKASRKLGWRQGNYVLTFLRQVFKFGRPHGLIEGNPAEGVIPKPRPRDAGYANRPWSAAEEEIVFRRASPELRAALAVMVNTGLDPSDAIRMKRDMEQAGALRGLRGKTRAEIIVPIGARLAKALDQAPRHNATTLLASSKGTPWTYDGLATAFQRLKTKLLKEELIEPGLTMKGLRHTVDTTLRELGVDERTIADLLAQKTTSMGGYYSRGADLTVKNMETVRRLDEANEKRTRVVKPFPKKRQT